ncbi:hypothetical protein Rmf_39660 [Roseomonas fluvialis]|uniref:Uncharacterized protein n=1 Tax=Roseomonas fluvialis TaxID=1750527 RepID=A0ABN6P846_9PROT|nr:hypothetical protein Rmf_39660 [Roseomonas fluvialis]
MGKKVTRYALGRVCGTLALCHYLFEIHNPGKATQHGRMAYQLGSVEQATQSN